MFMHIHTHSLNPFIQIKKRFLVNCIVFMAVTEITCFWNKVFVCDAIENTKIIVRVLKRH